MKFNSYITEGNKADYILQKLTSGLQKLIKKDCKKYLKLLKKHNIEPFYRGVYEQIEPYTILKKNVRQNRTPLGTPTNEFKKLNFWLQKNGHVRRDKSVSAISDEFEASDFGTAYHFFPIGNFNYTWIMAKDLNMNDEKTGWEWLNVKEFFEGEEEYETQKEKNRVRLLIEYFPKWFTTNKGIEISHKNKYEIWFGCRSYYVVNVGD